MKTRGLLPSALWGLLLSTGHPYSTSPQEEKMDCVPCDVLFTKLQNTPSTRQTQHVIMQLRGEPKSGTGMIHQWASGMLHHACDFLRRSFGKNTCRTTWEIEDTEKTTATNRSLTFEPNRGGDGGQCACQDVDRVSISVSKLSKHELPVDPQCTWWHPNSITKVRNGFACPTVGQRPIANYSDVLACLSEANCTLTDNRPQLVILRDPRPVAVSSFYHSKKYAINFDEGVKLEEWSLQILPHICIWVTIRYHIFTETLADKSTVFWYHEAVADPLEWHRRFLDSVGLYLPPSVVKMAKDAAIREDFPFNHKSMDRHSETSLAEADSRRCWEEEVGAETAEAMTKIARVWLPPILLAKLGIPLE